jgi:Lar family restriction alleviation protein
MTELKPCPFCGGEATYLSSGNYYPKEFWKVICKNCSVCTIYKATQDRAGELWNRRVNNE